MDKPHELTGKIEPFDSFWEAPEDIEKGFRTFAIFYRHNYLKHLPQNRESRVLVISCGTGYFVHLLNQQGYKNVVGIDSDYNKVEYALKKGLNCRVANAFDFLEESTESYDFIFAEQEINHLIKSEIICFLELCWKRLGDKGLLIIHSLNGANPITGSEALSQNFDHYNTFTEYSLKQILEYSNFDQVKVIPLKLYVFFKNPANYVGIVLNVVLNFFFRAGFIFYGKTNKLFSKKIAAIAHKK